MHEPKIRIKRNKIMNEIQYRIKISHANKNYLHFEKAQTVKTSIIITVQKLSA